MKADGFQIVRVSADVSVAGLIGTAAIPQVVGNDRAVPGEDLQVVEKTNAIRDHDLRAAAQLLVEEADSIFRSDVAFAVHVH